MSRASHSTESTKYIQYKACTFVNEIRVTRDALKQLVDPKILATAHFKLCGFVYSYFSVSDSCSQPIQNWRRIGWKKQNGKGRKTKKYPNLVDGKRKKYNIKKVKKNGLIKKIEAKENEIAKNSEKISLRSFYRFIEETKLCIW